MSQSLHLTGTIVVGDGAELDECWVVDGRLTLDPPDEPAQQLEGWVLPGLVEDRKSTRLNSSHVAISYAVFCLKKKTREPLHISCTHKCGCHRWRLPGACA